MIHVPIFSTPAVKPSLTRSVARHRRLAALHANSTVCHRSPPPIMAAPWSHPHMPRPARPSADVERPCQVLYGIVAV